MDLFFLLLSNMDSIAQWATKFLFPRFWDFHPAINKLESLKNGLHKRLTAVKNGVPQALPVGT